MHSVKISIEAVVPPMLPKLVTYRLTLFYKLASLCEKPFCDLNQCEEKQ